MDVVIREAQESDEAVIEKFYTPEEVQDFDDAPKGITVEAKVIVPTEPEPEPAAKKVEAEVVDPEPAAKVVKPEPEPVAVVDVAGEDVTEPAGLAFPEITGRMAKMSGVLVSSLNAKQVDFLYKKGRELEFWNGDYQAGIEARAKELAAE